MNEVDVIPSGYLRVTEVLQPFSKLHTLDPKVVQKAADRGTRAHKFCELYALNILLVEVDEDCKHYVDAFMKWFDETVVRVIASEKRINSEKYKLTGKFDFIVQLKGDTGFTLLDIKTPATDSPSWQLQTAAYRVLIEYELCIEISRRVCLMLPKEAGIAKCVEYTDHAGDQRKYLNALELYRFFNG